MSIVRSSNAAGPPGDGSADNGSATLAVHLMGTIGFDECLALQQRLVYETAGQQSGNATLLVCEHPLEITIGRQG
jgi:hypothetical protein